jgi:cbb3-type cytochrome oxidase maturation protein
VDILFLLVPFSVVVVFIIIGVFAWAMRSGQFEDVEREGLRILEETPNTKWVPGSRQVDVDQVSDTPGIK